MYQTLLEDTSKVERWEKQLKKLKEKYPQFASPPACKCGELMKWYKSDTYGYYYRCPKCNLKKRRKYWYEFYTDKDGRTQLRKRKV